MKTKRTKKISSESGLPIRPEQLSTEQTDSQTQTTDTAPAPTPTPAQPPLQPIDFARRRANRELPTEQVLLLLQQQAPGPFNLAEVVGRWVWIQFRDKQPRHVTAVLSELGFHWNNKRQAWQHPCGSVTPGTQSDPREKYPNYFPSDVRAA